MAFIFRLNIYIKFHISKWVGGWVGVGWGGGPDNPKYYPRFATAISCIERLRASKAESGSVVI